MVFSADVVADLHCENIGGDAFGAVRSIVQRQAL
jgi:hypothetical protein